MRRGARFPADAAELVLSDILLEQLVGRTEAERTAILVDLVRLCDDPGGKHPLRAPLAGWNTLEVLGSSQRVIYRATVVDGVGLLEALCLGPRTDAEVYDMAVALRDAGILTDEELSALWDALAILDIVAEQVGLDGWDFRPEPAPEGMRRAAVAAGLLDEDRCGALLPRARRPCIRRAGHPGPHRST